LNLFKFKHTKLLEKKNEIKLHSIKIINADLIEKCVNKSAKKCNLFAMHINFMKIYLY